MKANGGLGMRWLLGGCLALMLSGCGSMGSGLIAAYMRATYPGQPAVNAIEMNDRPSGAVTLTSVWYVAGPQEGQHRPLVPLAAWAQPANLGVKLLAPADAAQAVQVRLRAGAADCPSMEALLGQSLEQAGALFTQWYGPDFAVDHDLVVLPPSQGGSGWWVATAQPSERPHVRLGTFLFESDACAWRRHWAYALAETMVHESVHTHSHLSRPQPVDPLRDEFVAYAAEACLFARVYGPGEVRQLTFPGLDAVGNAPIMAAADEGRMPPTIAGRVLVYRWWRDDRLPHASPRPDCDSLIQTYPDPRRVMP